MNKPRITIDFETRSKCDLLTAGTYKYSQDPSTEVLMMSFILENGDPDKPLLWHNTAVTGIENDIVVELLLEELHDQIARGALIEAHNAGFEIDIWRNVCSPRLGWPEVPFDQWRCSAAKAAYYALPRSLDGLAKALGIKDIHGNPVEKDKEGYQLMLWLCSPDPKTGKWNGTTKDFIRLGEYCQVDTRTEYYCSAVLPDIIEKEQQIWKLDWQINDRGILANRSMVEAAVDVARIFGDNFNAQLPVITEGAVERPSQRQRIKKWALDMGVNMADTQATTVEKLLKEPDSKVPQKVKLVLSILVQGTRTSTAKYKAMLDAICDDDRIRGTTMYHGATTGRWTGKGVQPHNFPRGSLKEKAMLIAIQDILEGFEWLSAIYDDVGKLLSDALRGVFMAPKGRKLCVADFSAVEARVTAWVSGQQDLLDLFASGGLIYEDMAEAIYGYPVNKDDHPHERFIGKQAILGLGFQMGWKKFRDTLRDKFDTVVTADFAKKVVKIYRNKNTKIVEMWDLLNQGAIEAVRTGQRVTTGKVTWFTQKIPGVGIFLRCLLPSGRALSYPFPMLKHTAVYFFDATETTVDSEGNSVSEQISVRVSVARGGNQKQLAIREFKRQATEHGYQFDPSQWVGEMSCKEDVSLTFMGVDAKTKQWLRQDTYGGKLMENVVQATARDFLAYAMLRVDATGRYDIVLTVHDEVVTECDLDKGSYKELEELMDAVEPWGEGCPIASEGWEGPVYRK